MSIESSSPLLFFARNGYGFDPLFTGRNAVSNIRPENSPTAQLKEVSVST
jgi:hypothetical protein